MTGEGARVGPDASAWLPTETVQNLDQGVFS